jgi:nicotinamide riboside transporter PnuC
MSPEKNSDNGRESFTSDLKLIFFIYIIVFPVLAYVIYPAGEKLFGKLWLYLFLFLMALPLVWPWFRKDKIEENEKSKSND